MIDKMVDVVVVMAITTGMLVMVMLLITLIKVFITDILGFGE